MLIAAEQNNILFLSQTILSTHMHKTELFDELAFPGNIKQNENGDVGDDDYHLFLEDTRLLILLGQMHIGFRFHGPEFYQLCSSKPEFHLIIFKIITILRSFNGGTGGRFGEVHPSGIKFYNKIIDNVLVWGIEPFVTIHHFDHPQELEDRYGS
ncbi:beta-glucosidase 18-like isoform X1 [Durio zibethinus]|uniref:Beta-glucosidase 18-like isoform X1 n=1 Tax=Durio zibethinus TaxID=66656 RepID=A0A6P5Y1L3_DURZI|nr:beta-glucosidase 18-like isoform X1 [Durio zibethinus]